MFYLTYRPRTISEIDNSKVTSILAAILKEKRLPHALLFVGQKGTGKTSTARIFAKSVNCLNKKSGSIEPCNTCDNCKSIDKSTSADVFEMDAASNRGIEEIKKIIKESSFMPMLMNYRVFIIDEAHMITTDAFNALLKTLEEPPKSVIFILATTNQEKLPKTIISRCTVVNFGRAIKKDIVHMLERIINQEKISVDPKVLNLISNYSENSFRDASKLLEELLIQKKLTVDEAKLFLGIARQNFLEILERKTLKEALDFTNEFVMGGGSVKRLLEEVLEELRLNLLKKSGVTVEVERESTMTKDNIIKLMRKMTDAYTLLKTSPIESLPLEIAVVEFYNQK